MPASAYERPKELFSRNYHVSRLVTSNEAVGRIKKAKLGVGFAYVRVSKIKRNVRKAISCQPFLTAGKSIHPCPKLGVGYACVRV